MKAVMNFLNKILGRDSALERDARRIYASVMAQSRRPEFYGKNAIADNYDGRIDVLTLHIAAILKALNSHGEQGEKLGQALFDEMKDDFEIALREEGISDTGVKKRIKPMISLFYARVKSYTKALIHEAPQGELIKAFEAANPDSANSFLISLSDYLLEFNLILEGKSLGEIAMTAFDYPPLSQLKAS